jgi:hypothetical protein
MHSAQESNWGPISRVHEGMHVTDATGQDVGEVEMVQMGDAEAATTEGNDYRRPTALEYVAESLGAEHEPDVPEPLRSRLVRSGYIKVDGPGLLESDRYVPSDYVRDVDADTVHLSVRKDDLVREH